MPISDGNRGIESVISAWRARYPNRADGGLRAVRGFRYQYLLALNKAIQLWQPHGTTNPLFAVEALSDLVCGEDTSKVIVCQAKRSATSTSVLSALEELFEIFLVAHEISPSLAMNIKYKIIALFGNEPKINEYITNFKPTGVNGTILNKFKAQTSCEITGDPLDELLKSLAFKFNCATPLSTVERWVGQLINLSEGGLDDFSRRLWDELRAAISGNPPPQWCQVWNSSDHPPAQVLPGEVLTGQAARPFHLKNGFFAFRSDTYNDLFKAFDKWVKDLYESRSSGDKVQVFWISGRSGSGKSVALLHLLSKLSTEGWSPIIWLGGQVSRLPEAVPWANKLAIDQPPIIALDDPYTPLGDSESKSLWRESGALLQTLSDQGHPVLLVCAGPTEQAELMVGNHSENFQITQHVIAPLDSNSAINELRSFFESRCNALAQVDTLGDILLVQRMFQWKIGSSIYEFAQRFKSRASTLKLDNILGTILAINRFYVGLPSEYLAELKPEERDSLDRLLDEHHFEIDNERNGIWISHPHLANEFFNAWYPIREKNLRTHLTQWACQFSLAHGPTHAEQTAPLWALERATRPGHDPLLENRLNGINIEELIQKIWLYTTSMYPLIPTSILPVWVKLENRYNHLFIHSSPRQVAVQRINSSPVDVPNIILWETLWETSQIKDDLIEIGIAWLKVLPAKHPSWGYIWTRIRAILKDDHRLQHSGHKWLAETPPEHGSWKYIWEELWLANPGDEVLAEIGKRWLRSAPLYHGSWKFVWELLWAQEEGNAELSDLGLNWLRNAPIAHKSWQYLWKLYWLKNPGSPALAQMGIAWLKNAPSEHDSWTWAWEELWKHFPGDPNLFEIGKSWLKITDNSHPSYTYVWKALWAHSPNDDELLRLGIGWLVGTPNDHKAWGVIWEIAWDQKINNNELFDLGKNWLNDNSSTNGAWTFIWKKLWLTNPNNTALLQLGLGALRLIPNESPAWTYLWEDIWAVTNDKELIATIGKEWLITTPFINPAWSFVWKPLWLFKPLDGQLYNLGLTFLDHAPDNSAAWTYVWEQLWAQCPDDPGLLNLGIDWLESNFSNKSWAFVWKAIWLTNSNDAKILKLGKIWICNISDTQPGKNFVTRSLERRAIKRLR